MGERVNFYSGLYSEIYNFYGLCSTIIFRIIDFGRILYIISIVSLFVAIAIIRYVRSSMIAGKTRILRIECVEPQNCDVLRADAPLSVMMGAVARNHESPRPNPRRQQNISPLDYTGLPIG